MADDDKRSGKRKYDPLKGGKEGANKPPFSPDQVERRLEADDTKALYADESIHDTREQKFAFDADGPVGGPVPDIRSPIDEADELERQRRGEAADEDERS